MAAYNMSTIADILHPLPFNLLAWAFLTTMRMILADMKLKSLQGYIFVADSPASFNSTLLTLTKFDIVKNDTKSP